ncbi:hypothetical protein KUL113_09440 [Tenacibaculum sp. KUL113]|nr:hypothetical protein KUL113_09440 [Tenacibaculum sp. KUL113]
MRIEFLFSELNGFAIFDLKSLVDFKEKYIKGNDILTPLVETNLGEEISANGIAIPIIGVEADDYGFILSINERSYLSEVEVKSTGWILNSTGILGICGIGYLKDFTLEKLIKINKIIEFKVPKGWLKIEIYGGVNNDYVPVFEIVVKESTEKPEFEGDLSTNFNF